MKLTQMAIALLVVGGLLWYFIKSKNKNSAHHKNLWPEQVNDPAVNRELLASRDPWEIAEWLVANFTNRAEVWPELASDLQDLGCEGVYLSALAAKGPDNKAEIALQALAVVGTAKSVPLLLKALAEKDENLSMGACFTLKKLNLPESARPLVESLVNSSKILPARSADILLSLGPAGMRAVAEALPHADVSGKTFLLEILGEFKDKDILETLTQYVRHADQEVRFKAVESIGKLNVSEVGPLLIEVLHDPFWKVRAAAVRILGDLRYEHAIQPLRELYQDPEWHVQISAKEAVEQIAASIEG